MINGLGNFFTNVLIIILAASPFVLIICFSIYRTKKKFKKEDLEMAKLPPELQAKKKKDGEQQVINALTVILPMAIFLTLRNSMNIGEALIISVIVGIIFRQVINYLQKRGNKPK